MPEVMGVLADVGLTEGERRDTVAKIQAIPARWPDGRPTCADDASRPPADGTYDKEASVVSGPLVFVNVPALYMGEFSLSADRGGSPVGSPTPHEGVAPRPFVGGVSGTRERGAGMERNASVGSDMSELSEPRSPEQPEEQSEGIDSTADPSCADYGSEYVQTKRRGKRLVHC